MALWLWRYDFLDFGASKGGAIELARQRLGGDRGLGVDNDPRKVEGMREQGYDCIVGDVAELAVRNNAVRFVTMSHFLEHLPDVETVERVVGVAARVARDFLFIQGPWFDADDYLAKRGLRFYWSNWSGHKCHVSTDVLREAFAKAGLDDYVLMARVPVVDSADPAIQPLAAGRNRHDYDPEEDPPKPDVTFDIPVYREMVALVRLPGFRRSRFWQRTVLPSWEELLKVRPGCHSLPEPSAPEKTS